MKLVIDIGNTRIKAAWFNQKTIEQVQVFHTIEQMQNLPFKNAKQCIISSVSLAEASFAEFFSKECRLLYFNSATPVPLQVLYQSPQTLGADRLALAVAANTLFPNQNVLAIDAGTCITYDFVNHQNQYLGGGISPGITMRLKALQHFTQRLPLVQKNDSIPLLLGRNTEECILSGVLNGTTAEVLGIIEQYKSTYPNLQLAFTGGDVSFFEKQFKNHIFANPNLVLIGLNEILDYNI
jgi:type III pantothenate kinase